MIIINDFKYMNVYILIDFSRCIYEVYCTDVNYIGRQTIQKLVGPDWHQSMHMSQFFYYVPLSNKYILIVSKC